MAKLTALQIQNEVERNNGLTASSALTSLTGLPLKIFNFINQSIMEIGLNDDWIPLESNESITLLTTVSTYTKTSTINKYDIESFRYDESKKLRYVPADQFDKDYPCQTNTGVPFLITEHGGYLRPYYIPSSVVNNKVVKYRAWKIPTLLNTGTATGTSWFPEGYDYTVLVNYATYKVMEFRYMEEYKEYKKKVMGDREFGEEGFLNMMRRNFRSYKTNKIQVTAV